MSHQMLMPNPGNSHNPTWKYHSHPVLLAYFRGPWRQETVRLIGYIFSDHPNRILLRVYFLGSFSFKMFSFNFLNRLSFFTAVF